MKITYINHSCFMLESEDVCFLFDYDKGEIPPITDEKDMVVFVSHKHGDHYNPEIFDLVKKYSRIQFVVSKDVPVKWQILKYKEQGIDLEKQVTVVRKNAEYCLFLKNERKLQIETLKSTDEGVAYLVTYDGRCYYHAGDLHLWLWEGESKQYNDNMAGAYFRELEKLREKQIEVAFVPLDGRLGKYAFEGMNAFLENTKCRKVFPMHFWGAYDIIEKYLTMYPEYREQIVKMKEAGQVFYI